MKLNRRSFLGLSASLGAAYADRSWSLDRVRRRQSQYAVCQTYTDSESASFTAILPKSAIGRVSVHDSLGVRKNSVEVQTRTRQDSRWTALKIQVRQLTLGETFTLTLADDSSGHVEQRQFKTLDLEQPEAKVALISCMSDKFHRSEMWYRLEDHQTDAIFFIGDAVYADQTATFEFRPADERQLWERFVQAWQTMDFYKWPELKPVFAIWDDHDYGANNADRQYRFKQAAVENFNYFYGPSEDSKSLSRGPGTSFELEAFGQQFLFLDGRTFRSEPGASDQTLLGEEQESWLMQKLAAGDGPAWLILGSQWFGGYLEKESYENTHPESFWRMMNELKSSRRFMTFISGDVHFTELMELEPEILGYPTWELTSSCMHSTTVPGWHRFFHNPRRVASTGMYNFVNLDLSREPDGRYRQRVSAFGNQNASYFARERLVTL